MTKRFMVFLAGAFTACLFLSSETIVSAQMRNPDGDKPTTCGNGELDFGPEICDGPVFLKNCEEAGYDGGSPVCSSDCQHLSFSTCLTYSDSTCNNGKLDFAEACDGDIFIMDQTCQDGGYDGGTLLCSPDCQSVTYANCTKSASRKLLSHCSIGEDKELKCLSAALQLTATDVKMSQQKANLHGFPCDDGDDCTMNDVFDPQGACKGAIAFSKPGCFVKPSEVNMKPSAVAN